MGKMSYRIDSLDITAKRTVKIINETEDNTPLVLINEKRYSKSLIRSIPVTQIKSFRVEKCDTVINNVHYSIRICITTNDEYILNPVTMETIKEKYTDNRPFIFLVNNEIVIEDLNDYYIDENSILQITKGKIKSLGIYYINILTKTEENEK